MNKKIESLKAEHKQEIIESYPKLPIKLIEFAFDCWGIQRFKDACGKPIPKQHAINFLIMYQQ